MMRFTRDAEIALTEAYQPQGINVGINLGRPAGAGIIDHIHIHLVPRWTGDTNFMSVIGDVRVLPEDLHETVDAAAADVRAAARRIAERLERAITTIAKHEDTQISLAISCLASCVV